MDRDNMQKIESFREENYCNIDLDHLMIYAMGQIHKMGVDLSFENAVVAVFRLFPKKFALLGFPEYPDSDRVMNCLNRCTKPKRWINGRPRQGFSLNERSEIFINETEVMLKVIAREKTKSASQTRRKEFILAEILESSAYLKYQSKQAGHITEAELCNLLQGTLDSDKSALKDNLFSLKMFSKELNKEQIAIFLDWVELQFQYFFNRK
jgi:hypothetical protein